MALHLPTILFVLLFFSIGFGSSFIFRDAPSQEASHSEKDPNKRRRKLHARDSLASANFREIDDIIQLLTKVSNSEECQRLAHSLNADPDNRHNKTLWSLLLASWAEISPEGMMAFLDSEKKYGRPTHMEELAWEAWGISSPDSAAPHLRSIGYHERRALIKGITQIDPSLALAIAKSAPNTSALLSTILYDSPDLSIEDYQKIQEASESNRYRFRFPPSQIAKVAQNNPQSAFEIALQQKSKASGSFPTLIGEIAKVNPEATKQFLSEQPTSREKSLAIVEVAKKIAFQDPDHSLEYARSLHPGLTRDASLISIASIVGGEDPLKGLSLIEEANWSAVSTLSAINNGTASRKISYGPSGGLSTSGLAADLLSNLAVSDLAEAERYLETVVPEDQREEILKLFRKP